MVHWSKGPPGVLCLQHAEGGVVVPVVHGGSAGFVQEQNVSPLILHCSRTNFLQALKSAPDKAPHSAWISSAHCFEPQSGGAALGPETKTPAASATVANRTAAPRAILVIVGPPVAVPMQRSISALYHRVPLFDTFVKGESPAGMAAMRPSVFHHAIHGPSTDGRPVPPRAVPPAQPRIGLHQRRDARRGRVVNARLLRTTAHHTTEGPRWNG
jgi:hypothetical protein